MHLLSSSIEEQAFGRQFPCPSAPAKSQWAGQLASVVVGGQVNLGVVSPARSSPEASGTLMQNPSVSTVCGSIASAEIVFSFGFAP